MNPISQKFELLSEHETFHFSSKDDSRTMSQFLEPFSPSIESLYSKSQTEIPFRLPTSASNTHYFPTHDSPKDFAVDLNLLKQTIVSLISEMNDKHKEKYKKKEKIKQLEGLCIKNKKKIKKMRASIKDHEEKIIMLERKLNNPQNSTPTSLSSDKQSPRQLVYDRSFIPKFSAASGSSLNLVLSSSRLGTSLLPEKKETPSGIKTKHNNK